MARLDPKEAALVSHPKAFEIDPDAIFKHGDERADVVSFGEVGMNQVMHLGDGFLRVYVRPANGEPSVLELVFTKAVALQFAAQVLAGARSISAEAAAKTMIDLTQAFEVRPQDDPSKLPTELGPFLAQARPPQPLPAPGVGARPSAAELAPPSVPDAAEG